MERMNRIISLLLVALIGCVTVFQCHHHDADGHAFFLTYGDNEVTSGLSHGDCHSHDDGVADGEQDGECGMHLADAMAIGRSYIVDIFLGITCCVLVDYFYDFSSPEIYLDDCLLKNLTVGAVTAGYSHANLLRGPPSV